MKEENAIRIPSSKVYILAAAIIGDFPSGFLMFSMSVPLMIRFLTCLITPFPDNLRSWIPITH